MDKTKSEDQISVKELITQIMEWFMYLLSHWKIICLVGILGAALGLTYSFMQKPIYTASLSFVIEDQQQASGLGGALGLVSQFGFDIGENGGGIFSGTNLIELFKSRTMVEKVLMTSVISDNKTISFAELYIQKQHWREKWNKNARFKNITFIPDANREQFSRAQDSILGSIYEALSANSLKVGQKDKKIDIITIDFQSGDEYFAKVFTEELAKQVSDFYILTKSKKARMNMDILEKQTDSIRGELNAAITGVAASNDNTFGLNPALNIKRTPSAKRQVDVQANTAVLIELVKQTELAKVTLRKETPLIQIIDHPIFPLKREKTGKLKGLIIGGFVFSFLIVFILIIKKVFKKIMSS